MLDAVHLVRRQVVPGWLNASCYAGGLALGLGLATAMLVGVGVPSDAILDEFITQAFFSPEGIAETLTAAIPLVLVGVAASLSARVRFWNIGIEGQLGLGAIAATWVATNDLGPPALRLPLMLGLALVAGAAWMLVPLVLKLRLEVSEVITTLLLGNVAFYLLQHLLFGVWRDPSNGFPISREFGPSEQLSLLGFGQVHGGLWIALAVGLLAWLVLEHTSVGLVAKAVGLNPAAARASGLPVTGTVVGLVLASGGVCGLAGALIVAGTEHHLSQSVASGYLFSGITIAFLARYRIVPAMAVAVVVGGTFTAGSVLKVFYSVSEAAVVFMQGTVLVTVLVSQFFSTFRIARSR